MKHVMRHALPALALGALALLAGCKSGGPAGPRSSGPRATAVRAVPVEIGSLVLRSSYPGELVADAVELAPKVVGRIESVAVEVGERVEKGAVVARLDPAQLRQELRQAEAQMRAAEANRARADARIAAAKAELDRKEPLAARQLVSAQELAEIRAELGALEAERAGAVAEFERARASAGALREQLSDLSLRAPWDALVAARLLEPGATANASTPVVRLVRAGPLEVRFRVPERDAAVVRLGQRLEVRTQATADEGYSGRVLRIAGEVNRADRSLLTEGVLDEDHQVLRAGMFATVELMRTTLEGATLVPSAALLRRLGETGVFVAEEEVARWRPVQVAGEQGGVSAIEGAVEEGDRVLVFGHDDLADGSPIRVVEAQAPVAGGGS